MQIRTAIRRTSILFFLDREKDKTVNVCSLGSYTPRLSIQPNPGLLPGREPLDFLVPRMAPFSSATIIPARHIRIPDPETTSIYLLMEPPVWQVTTTYEAIKVWAPRKLALGILTWIYIKHYPQGN
jgi:hypothetical protein